MSWILEEGTGLLQELPYVDLGKGAVFDLEFEGNERAENLTKLLYIIIGGELTDKHGTKIHLKGNKALSSFVNQIKSNPQVKRLIGKPK